MSEVDVGWAEALAVDRFFFPSTAFSVTRFLRDEMRYHLRRKKRDEARVQRPGYVDSSCDLCNSILFTFLRRACPRPRLDNLILRSFAADHVGNCVAHTECTRCADALLHCSHQLPGCLSHLPSCPWPASRTRVCQARLNVEPLASLAAQLALLAHRCHLSWRSWRCVCHQVLEGSGSSICLTVLPTTRRSASVRDLDAWLKRCRSSPKCCALNVPHRRPYIQTRSENRTTRDSSGQLCPTAETLEEGSWSCLWLEKRGGRWSWTCFTASGHGWWSTAVLDVMKVMTGRGRMHGVTWQWQASCFFFGEKIQLRRRPVGGHLGM